MISFSCSMKSCVAKFISHCVLLFFGVSIFLYVFSNLFLVYVLQKNKNQQKICIYAFFSMFKSMPPSLYLDTEGNLSHRVPCKVFAFHATCPDSILVIPYGQRTYGQESFLSTELKVIPDHNCLCPPPSQIQTNKTKILKGWDFRENESLDNG